jgi:NAD(P)-dependent dehydrogenase (short-subunit alcohol dehydrogenase family)
MPPLAGKVAIVTGAGRYRGIGRHIALTLARHGADVVVTGSGRPPEQFPDDEREMGWRDVESVAEEARELGTGARRGHDRVPLLELEESEWRRVIEVNLMGTFLVTKAVGNALIEQGEGGRIVNISSIAGRQGMPNFGAYATTKAGVIMFTQVLAAELARHRINVNCVCPGLVDTYRMEDWTRGPMRDAILPTIPLGRPGDPKEIGDLVAFLCGPEATYIHGQTINIDGGRLMM